MIDVLRYVDVNGRECQRPMRLYSRGPGRLVAVVTEPWRAPGMSITNAVEQVAEQLAVDYPDHVVEVVEHYPACGDGQGFNAEHHDLVIDCAEWRRLSPAELAELCATPWQP